MQAGLLDEADRVRVRVALENQSMLMGVGGLVASLPRLAKSVVTSRALTRDELIAGLPQGTKITPENVVDIRRLSDGRTVWLETGDARRGLQHIIGRHAENFADRGVSRDQIPDLIFEAIENGRVVGSASSGRNARSIYEVDFNGTTQRLSVGVADNGFIVTANPN